MTDIADVFEVPLKKATAQKFNIMLNGASYNFNVRYNNTLYGGGLANPCWFADIFDVNNNPLYLGCPFITGADLLAQFRYLGIAGGLLVQTDNDPKHVPTYLELGDTGHLYFVRGLGAPVPVGVAAQGGSVVPINSGPAYREVKTLGQVNVQFGDEIIGIDTSALAQAVNFQLPAAAARNGVPLTFKDITRMAGTWNVTVTCDGDETIDPPGGAGAPTAVLQVNGQGMQLLPVRSNDADTPGGWVRLG